MDMVKKQKEELQKRGEKGFTLMEMLIVVAIIAILIAIAIPVFTSQLNKSKQAADEANARSLYAALTADYMTSGSVTLPTAASTVTYDGTKYTFTDRTTDLKITANATTSYPTVSITSNGNSQSFGQ